MLVGAGRGAGRRKGAGKLKCLQTTYGPSMQCICSSSLLVASMFIRIHVCRLKIFGIQFLWFVEL